MVEKYNIRTDLALEEKERFESDQVRYKELCWRKNMIRSGKLG